MTIAPARLITALVTAGILSFTIIPTLQAQDHRSGLRLTAPISRWDEAIPLGNGVLGALLWGGDSTLNLSLDRGDLWDDRLPATFASPDWNWATMQRLVAADSMPRFHALFDDPYERIPYPTKLPGGRLVITRLNGAAVQHFDLDLHHAEAQAVYAHDTVRAVVPADGKVLLLQLPGTVTLTLIPPGGVEKLGYPAANLTRRDDEVAFVQQGAVGFRYAVVATARHVADQTLIAVSLAANQEYPAVGATQDPLAVARARTRAALDRGWDGTVLPHRTWWQRFWTLSGVTLPDSALQAHYDLVRYFYGAAGRRRAPAIPLQGVWTADAGGLPPWKGDFHNDLNTQMTYLAAHTARLDEPVLGWLDQLERSLPTFRRFAHDFYGVDGAVVPGVMTLSGKPMAGWGMYSLSPTNGAWVAWSFWQQWRVTRDREFLRTRAYPFVREVGTALGALLRPDASGHLVLPLSSSPEIHDNSRAAFLTPNSSYDLALLTWCFGALEEMATTLDRHDDAVRWRTLLNGLAPLVTPGRTAPLQFAAGEPFQQSHRHFSHAMAIHPLGLLSATGPDSATVRATVDQIAARGTSEWTGYSFAWFAAMLARTNRGDEALTYLSNYLHFTLRNGFHANGDQSGLGLSSMTYRPFTLEGNFLAMDAVQEMLVRSDGTTVQLFPATPAAWRDVSFHDLRVDGAWLLSASRVAGRTTALHIVAGASGTLRLSDPFDGAPAVWSRRNVRREGGQWLIAMRKGESVTATRRPVQ